MKAFLIFPEMEPSLFNLSSKNKENAPREKFLHFFKRKLFLYFRKRNPEKVPYISGNGTFLYFRKGIFRTLAYLEPETYSEHYQTSTMERVAKIATQRTF